MKSVPSNDISLFATNAEPSAVIVIVRPTLSFSSKSVSVARVPDDMLAGVSAGLAIVGVMRTCLSPVPVLSSFEQAVKTIAATAVNVKILFIILSFKLKIISYTQRRRDPVGLRDVFQTKPCS